MSTPISLVSATVGDTTVIRFEGEVDISNIDDVSVRAAALSARAKSVALDFTDLTYIDSAGVRFVDDLACQCDRRGALFVVVVPKAAMTRRLLELTLPNIALSEELAPPLDLHADEESDGRA
jgi:anti-anti-sigma factor